MTKLYTQKNQPNGGVPRIYDLIGRRGTFAVLVEYYQRKKIIYATEEILRKNFNLLKK